MVYFLQDIVTDTVLLLCVALFASRWRFLEYSEINPFRQSNIRIQLHLNLHLSCSINQHQNSPPLVVYFTKLFGLHIYSESGKLFMFELLYLCVGGGERERARASERCSRDTPSYPARAHTAAQAVEHSGLFTYHEALAQDVRLKRSSFAVFTLPFYTFLWFKRTMWEEMAGKR